MAEYVPVAVAQPYMPYEEKQAAKIMGKRQEELTRRQRIFDAKRRTIGLDKMTLDQQVADKHMGDELEKERNAHFDEQALYFNNVIKMQELEATRKRREIELQCKEYSIRNLGKGARDTFDLEDPQALKKDLPPRDPRQEGLCGPSSFQIFAGEDRYRHGRVKQMQRQQRDWIEQQKFERSMLAQQAEGVDLDHAQNNREVAEIRADIEKDERECRIELEKARQMFNLQMQDDRSLNDQLQKRWGTELESQELHRNLTDGGMAYEHTEVKGGAEFKGLGADAIDDILRTREEQVVEKHERDHDVRQYEAQFARHSENVRKGLVGQLQSEQRTRRAMMENMVRENQAIAAAKRQDEQYRATRVYQNECSDDFWGQFGTTSR